MVRKFPCKNCLVKNYCNKNISSCDYLDDSKINPDDTVCRDCGEILEKCNMCEVRDSETYCVLCKSCKIIRTRTGLRFSYLSDISCWKRKRSNKD